MAASYNDQVNFVDLPCTGDQRLWFVTVNKNAEYCMFDAVIMIIKMNVDTTKKLDVEINRKFLIFDAH